ncbi:MAG: helix-turn-helix domain-containing protein [Bryobacteraceae bacterium]|jgi:cytoskeletal protein RodZ
MEADILGLREWRQRKGISLDAIAASTKLSVRQLEAIESGDFRKLPGGIYNTSYIKQYARAIDFDEAQILAYYHGKEAISAEELAPIGARRPFRFVAG